eukprot:gene7485-257_t
MEVWRPSAHRLRARERRGGAMQPAPGLLRGAGAL